MRVDAHHGMVGPVDGGGKHLFIVAAIGLTLMRALCGIVIGIAMGCPQLFGCRPERRGQALVGSHCVGPNCVAADLGNGHPAQDRNLGIGIDEGDVRVPGIGSATSRRVKFEDRCRAVAYMLGRMWNKIAEAPGKALLLGIGQLILVAEYDHLVLQLSSIDGCYRRKGRPKA